MISIKRHRLSLDNGRVSAMRTLSPICAWFFSSCTLNLAAFSMTLPYKGCSDFLLIWTTMVFCILLLRTIPVLFFLKLSLVWVVAGILFFFPDRADLGDLFANQLKLMGFLERPHRFFLSQVKQLFLQCLLFLIELRVAQASQILCFDTAHQLTPLEILDLQVPTLSKKYNFKTTDCGNSH